MKPARRKTSTHSPDGESGDDYKKKRERNNAAVKKCRQKTNEQAKQTKERVEKLKSENSKLEGSIGNLKKNVEDLKKLLLSAKPSAENKHEINKILEEFDDEKLF